MLETDEYIIFSVLVPGTQHPCGVIHLSGVAGVLHSLALGVGLRGAHVLEVVVVLGLDVRAMKDHILKLHNHLIMVGIRFYPDIGIAVGPAWVR